MSTSTMPNNVKEYHKQLLMAFGKKGADGAATYLDKVTVPMQKRLATIRGLKFNQYAKADEMKELLIEDMKKSEKPKQKASAKSQQEDLQAKKQAAVEALKQKGVDDCYSKVMRLKLDEQQSWAKELKVKVPSTAQKKEFAEAIVEQLKEQHLPKKTKPREKAANSPTNDLEHKMDAAVKSLKEDGDHEGYNRLMKLKVSELEVWGKSLGIAVPAAAQKKDLANLMLKKLKELHKPQKPKAHATTKPKASASSKPKVAKKEEEPKVVEVTSHRPGSLDDKEVMERLKKARSPSGKVMAIYPQATCVQQGEWFVVRPNIPGMEEWILGKSKKTAADAWWRSVAELKLMYDLI